MGDVVSFRLPMEAMLSLDILALMVQEEVMMFM